MVIQNVFSMLKSYLQYGNIRYDCKAINDIYRKRGLEKR